MATAKFLVPQTITPAQFATLKASLVSQKAKVSGPDSNLSISNFHGIDATAVYNPVNSQLVIVVTGTHGIEAHLASSATIEAHINKAIADALSPKKPSGPPQKHTPIPGGFKTVIA
jgi:hypothetical protein